MEQAQILPPHDVYYLTADDTTALEPSAELIARFQPALLPLAEGLHGHQSFLAALEIASSSRMAALHLLARSLLICAELPGKRRVCHTPPGGRLLRTTFSYCCRISFPYGQNMQSCYDQYFGHF